MIATLTLGILLQAVAVDSADCVVAGKVIDAVTGAPLRKASLTIKAAQATTSTAETDTEGRFRFDHLRRGEYHLKAARHGFLPDERQVQVDTGEGITDLELALTPQAVLAGHVIDQDGDPVPDASVAYERVSRDKRQRFLESGNRETDADGYFLMAALKPGRYYVKARFPESSVKSDKEAYIETYYPSSPGRTAASALDLAPGQEVRNLQIRLRKARTFMVRGRLTFSDTLHPPAIDNLAMVPDQRSLDPGPEAYSTKVHSGMFEFSGVRPGSYVIWTPPNYVRDEQNESWRTLRLSCYHAITVDGSDVVNLVLQVRPPTEIKGAVHVDGPGKKIGFTLGRELGPMISVHVSDDGTFVIPNLQSDYYHLHVSPTDDNYVSQIRFAGQEVKDRVIDLTSGNGGPLEISLSPGAAEVSVAVKGRRNIDVLMWSADSYVSYVRRTDEEGRVTFKNLTPGDYRIAAWDDPEMMPVGSEPETLKEWNDTATNIKVHERSKKTVEISSIPPE